MGHIINFLADGRIKKISFLFVVIYIISYFNRTLGLPSAYREFCCSDDRTLNLFLIFIPVFILSVLISLLKLKNSYSFIKFTLIYLIIYLIIYFLMPATPDAFFWFQKESFVFFGTIIYFLISLILIITKSIQLKKSGN